MGRCEAHLKLYGLITHHWKKLKPTSTRTCSSIIVLVVYEVFEDENYMTVKAAYLWI